MIDWTKDVEVATLGHEDWEDFQPIHVNQDHVYGHLMRQDATHATVWNFSIVHFRNKPPEPKRVKGWVGIYRSANDVYTIAEIRKWRKDLPDELFGKPFGQANRVSCFEINVPEGYGLEERK